MVPQTALDFSKEMIKQQPFDRVWSLAAQSALNYIWDAAPWRWTIGTLSPILLTAGLQNFDVVTQPTDLVRLERCFITDDVSTRPVQPVATIPNGTVITGPPNFVAYIPGVTAKIRFESLYPDIGTKTPQFQAWYKLDVPLLAAQLGVAGVLGMDDCYYNVFQEWVLYYAYRYADDQRAGAAQVQTSAQGRQIAYTGQLGVAQAAIEELRQQELVIWTFPTDHPNSLKLQ